MIKIEDARAELEAKSNMDIHAETAWKWASRAAAAYETYNKTKSIKTLLDAEDFESEAREHASQVSPALLDEVIDAIWEYKYGDRNV